VVGNAKCNPSLAVKEDLTFKSIVYKEKVCGKYCPPPTPITQKIRILFEWSPSNKQLKVSTDFFLIRVLLQKKT